MTTTDQDTLTRLATAYADLTAEGKRVSTRLLRARAGVSSAAAAAFLRDKRAEEAAELPEVVAGRVQEFGAALWHLAYTQAVERTRQSTVDDMKAAADEIDRLETQIKKLTRERDTAAAGASEVKRLSEASLRSAKTIDRLTARLEGARDSIARYQREATELREKLSETKDELAETAHKLAEAERELQELNGKA
ncbi:hypothetical protein [Gordonia paraffinivorans]|uniref:hypothetical protein n=1 Tax=Gordonia paraffinivorans TaxID=175628 RepID=UPI001E3CEC87|nr:hypothetical protein [Gordonia paraffinivorans]MCD2143726.1 hypothetical protein [Gordonia paraffinivorans]